MTSEPIRIAMWSGPRNISTAMMRSFESRSDCSVTDEPFYGAFLAKTGIQQPMAGDVIASMDIDWDNITQTLCGPIPNSNKLWYQKHMPHHMVDNIDIRAFPDHRHAFLIRNPHQVVASYAAKNVTVTPDDLGYERQVQYVDQAAEITGKPPIILDSTDILRDPESHLRALCAALDISWDPAMLHWLPGPRKTDGIWASHWYGQVLKTTGFAPVQQSKTNLSAEQRAVADTCQKFYNQLSEYRIKIL